MAARENQGLQIALIIFVILTLLSIITAFFFFHYYKEQQELNTRLTSDKNSADQAANAAKAESQAYKRTIGAADAETADAIEKERYKEVEQHGKSLAEADQNYRALVRFMASELSAANKRIVELTAETKELTDKIAADEKSKNEEMSNYTNTVASTSKDLTGVRQTFTDARNEITQSKEDLVRTVEERVRDAQESTKQANDRVSSLTAEVTKLEHELRTMTGEKLRGETAAEIPDGKITGIDQRQRRAWINLGSADGLRRQVGFEVVSGDDSNPAVAKRKGKVEVVRLTDPHMAEVRIVEDNLSNPIMPGDLIFNTSWEPGRPERFALAGFMDINGDEISDRQLVRDLIARNGSLIDAEVADDGKRTGELSIFTKYLVLGKRPAGRAMAKDAEPQADFSDEVRGNYMTIQEEAKMLGVRIISTDTFLDYVGYKTEDRVVPLGKNAKAADFKPRLPDDVQRIVPGSTPPRDYRKPPPTSGRIGY